MDDPHDELRDHNAELLHRLHHCYQILHRHRGANLALGRRKALHTLREGAHDLPS